MALHFTIFSFFLLFLLTTDPPPASSISFNYSSFDQNSQTACSPDADGICYQGDAFFNKVIQLTKNQFGAPITGSTGRAVYSKPVPLWNRDTGEVTDFITHFSFTINAFNESQYGDGLAFFLSPYPSQLPPSSSGGYLGLVDSGAAFNASLNNTSFVAVEFDSYMNVWDPSSDHLGINVNSIQSAANVTWNNGIKRGATANAWVTYNSSTRILSVFLTYADNPTFNGTVSLSHTVNLRDVLPEYVAIGFSAATGLSYEIHNILSWSFSSSLEMIQKKTNNRSIGLVAGIAAGAGALTMGLGVLWFILWRKRSIIRLREQNEEGIGRDDDFSIDEEEFEKGRGPKRFPYNELAAATKNFAEEGKLGQGGFGAVYRGFLPGLNLDVAIKRVSRGSSQGKKEYISEVRIISRLRHRNLVQLIGWCHDRGELLLVYEFLPNGSLDAHLFRPGESIAWPERHKIVLGLASALLYLHEEWEQCVVHRDVKSSNLMLDSAFNAKLGDFGLARLVDHDRGSQTTVLAGTMGYLAPECVTAGKASKESDVYSFGVVALEIACGRRPVEPRREAGKVVLVNWVWELYGRGALLEAADERLQMQYDAVRMERLMVVGLWCAHPDYNHRPSIRQAIGVLNMEAPLPWLPSTMPVASYYAPPMPFSYTSSAGSVSTDNTTNTSSKSAVSSVSSSSPSSYLLKSHHTDDGT